ncbi:hypothetical protein TUM4438_41500 [Shewanella sairae]|uniref:Uncharacterized protein n=1 Tax=Shewanella sairae TaxID=190310 RepID=A0ABQ4PQN4_9GAMM|nr:hypothetical protein [Shewanella sairae]MCL1132364.1 hypothetical protein [Shewanella sairae]GIU51536.1 hypothetical protein TUM4438_41500 [Shewanella sairae]
MKEDLNNPIESIGLEAGDDKKQYNKTTTYNLPAEALTTKVQGVLLQKIEHFGSAEINDGKLVLVHPEP